MSPKFTKSAGAISRKLKAAGFPRAGGGPWTAAPGFIVSARGPFVGEYKRSTLRVPAGTVAGTWWPYSSAEQRRKVALMAAVLTAAGYVVRVISGVVFTVECEASE